MKTKKLLAFIAMSFIALIMLVTCKKDNFNELVGICPTPKVEYTVALSSNPVLGGTTIGNGTFPKDSIVTVNSRSSCYCMRCSNSRNCSWWKNYNKNNFKKIKN
jgi:hypothetical protein